LPTVAVADGVPEITGARFAADAVETKSVDETISAERRAAVRAADEYL
jgi:hypothetical protein